MPRKTDRRHRQGEESRLAILKATLAIASERGYDGTTVALVTERTGLPASSIYWHFGSKDNLLAATLEYSYREWRKTAPTWVRRPEPADFVSGLQARFQHAARAVVVNPEFWGLGLMLTLQQRIKEPAARTLFFQVRRDREETIAAWWADTLDPGAVAADPGLTIRLARYLMMMMDGLFIHVRSAGNIRDLKRLVSLLSVGLAGHLQAEGLAR